MDGVVVVGSHGLSRVDHHGAAVERVYQPVASTRNHAGRVGCGPRGGRASVVTARERKGGGRGGGNRPETGGGSLNDVS